MHECQRVVDLLAFTFSIRYGGLVNNWTVGEAAAAWECARGVVAAHLPDALSPSQGPGDRPHEDMWFALFNAATQQRAADTISPSHVAVPKMSLDTVDSLASAALVMTYATLTVSDDTHAVRLLDVWIAKGVGDVRLHSMRADLKLFELNRMMDGVAVDKSTKVKMLVSSILEDCEMVLRKNPNDANAIFAKAAVLTRGAMIGGLASLNVDTPVLRKQQSNTAKGRLQKLASRFYKQGMLAEEKRLPFFGPVINIDSKQMLSLIMMVLSCCHLSPTIPPVTNLLPGAVLLPPVTNLVPGAVLLPPTTNLLPGAVLLPPVTNLLPGAVLLPPVTNLLPGAVLLPPVTNLLPRAVLLPPFTNLLPGAVLLPPVTNLLPGAVLLPPVTNLLPGAVLLPPVTNLLPGAVLLPPVTNLLPGAVLLPPVTNLLPRAVLLPPVTNHLTCHQPAARFCPAGR
eukprot:gene18672-25190_t